MLAKKSELAVGVDVGNFSVKVAQLSRKGDILTIEGLGYSLIDHNNSDGITEAIKAACLEAKLSHKKVNASIASQGAVVRYLLLPQMNDDDLARAMEFEIERYVPFDKASIVSDYLVLKEKSDKKNVKILLVAARKEYVDARVKTLKDAGLEPEVMTIDSLVLKNVFDINYPEKKSKTVGILNVGAKTSNVNIVRDSVLYFMRDIQLGGDSITHLLKEKLDIDLATAEKTKHDLKGTDKEKFEIIEPVLGNLLNEVYLSFDYYESEFGMVVDEVLLCGGSAPLEFLANFLKENLNRSVSVLNPFQQISLSSAVSRQRFDAFAPAFVVSLGLALESFN